MSETIRDGTGTGYLTRVDSDNRLWTAAVSTPKITERAEAGQSYFLSINDAPLASGTDTKVIYLKNNDPTLYLYTNVLCLGWNGGNTNHNRTMTMYSVADTGTPTGSMQSVVVPNFLIGVGGVANGTFMRWDKTNPGGMTTPNVGTVAVGLICSQGMTYHWLHGALVFPPGQERCFSLKAEEDGVASMMAHIYYAPASG